MKETGIIMSGNHPKLVLDGIKTQTRRVINPQPTYHSNYILNWKDKGYWIESPRFDVTLASVCPYGQVGDRLWVRETHFNNSFFTDDQDNVLYRADGEFQEQIPEDYYGAVWTPSIHMFKWMARIWLEITEVRVERVQEITGQDCKAEGCSLTGELFLSEWNEQRVLIGKYARLWDSLNAKRGYGWAVNPWVWCITFKLIKEES